MLDKLFLRKGRNQKVLVIGWDGTPPELAFDSQEIDLPNLRKLMEAGCYGDMESTIPPITCPAWMSMMTGQSPGHLGFYGFRNRKDYTYFGWTIANSTMVRENTVWDLLSAANRRSILLGVPQTYPPKPLNGCMITSFLTPGTQSQYTFPKELKKEIEQVVPGYMLDTGNFRTDDKDALLAEIYSMTEKRFRLAEYLMKNKPWDFFMVVEMGPDRLHHGFWRFHDSKHPRHDPSRYQHVVRDYYQYLDNCTGRLVDIAGKDTTVLVVSDHGAQAMQGGFCINEWLIENGYLVLKNCPNSPTPLAAEMVDWSRTKAWGEGGYYARVFINVRGREPSGVIDPGEYDRLLDELTNNLEKTSGPDCKKLGTVSLRPSQLYPVLRGIPPDLIVLVGDLKWRSVGSVGLNTIFTPTNDTGPDDANHSRHGIFIMSGPGRRSIGRLSRIHITDVAPTILNLFGMSQPKEMMGRSLPPDNA